MLNLIRIKSSSFGGCHGTHRFKQNIQSEIDNNVPTQGNKPSTGPVGCSPFTREYPRQRVHPNVTKQELKDDVQQSNLALC